MTRWQATKGSVGSTLYESSDADWSNRAACRDVDPDELFVAGALQHEAKRRCRSCPVRIECLVDALDNRVEWGVWGGLTERERRAFLRAHPEVRSWRQVLIPPRAAS